MDILTYLMDVDVDTCAPVDVTIRTDTDLNGVLVESVEWGG